MATLYSNELKAVAVTENYLDNPKSVLKENCLTIQNFSYECVNRRNDTGELYGTNKPVLMEFKVRVNDPRHTKTFYRDLVLNAPFDFSILFNATFNTNNRLADYEDGMVVNGYVVQLQEEYHSAQNEVGQDEQIMLHVKILVRSVVYLGRENHFKNVFIN